jgi:hypothetical protein
MKIKETRLQSDHFQLISKITDYISIIAKMNAYFLALIYELGHHGQITIVFHHGPVLISDHTEL